jgi:predicted nucleic acid-binding protein
MVARAARRFGTTVLVVDASVLVTALADDGSDGDLARSRLIGEELAAPELINLEVASGLRRLTSAGQLPERRSSLAPADLMDLAIHRAPHLPLLRRCWELRANLTIYAAYIALAEAMEVVLRPRMSDSLCSSGPLCRIEVLRSP